MSTPLLEVQIKEYAVFESESRITYTLTSKSPSPIFLVQHQRLPFLRLSSDGTTIEIWMGIPPRSEVELNQFINALILPQTFELAAGAIANRTAVVKWPLTQSGYWLEKSEEVAIPLHGKTEVNVVIVQGFGISPLDSRRVRSIEELFEWQLTTSSQTVTLKLPRSRS